MGKITYACQVIPQQFTLFGGPMPTSEAGEVFWHMVNWGTDMEKYHQIGAAVSAFSIWQPYVFPWQIKPTARPEQAQWKIYWARDNVIHLNDGTTRPSPFNFKLHKTTLAVQYASPNLTCVINDDFDYSLNKPGPNVFNLIEVLAHEFGHGWRLGHTTRKDDIMFDRYVGGNVITDDTADGLHAAHGDALAKALITLPIGKRYTKLYVKGIIKEAEANKKPCKFKRLLW